MSGANVTVVAGALLCDGVVLGADCRLTVPRLAGRAFVVDDAQKILKLGDHSAIGFAGNLFTVSLMLGQLYGPQLRRRRLDGVSLRDWLPRFMRATYAALRRECAREVEGCEFIVGSTVPKRLQRIRVNDALKLLPKTAALKRDNHLVFRLLNAMSGKRGDAIVDVPRSCLGLLYSMKAPKFQPRDYSPLQVAAIGSGAPEVLRVFDTYGPVMFSDYPNYAVGWFMEAMAAAFASMQTDTVGGLFVVTAMTNGKVAAMLQSDTRDRQGSAVVIEAGRFVQLDRRTGKRLALRLPGEIHRAPPIAANPFTPYRALWSAPPPLVGRRLPEFVSQEQRTELLRQQTERDHGHKSQ